MADESAQDKTEQATSRKKEKAHEKGQVARNRDLVSMTAMGGTVLIFYFGGANLFRGLYSMMGGVLSLSYGSEPLHLCRVVTVQGARILAPFFISSVVLVFLASLMQGGFVKKDLKFDFGKINPGQGIKKIISMQGLTELFKSLLKFSAGGWIVYYIINKDMKVLPNLSAMELNEIVRVSAKLLMEAVVTAYSFYMIIAIFSYFIERWQFDRSLKMSKQEIRDENREIEGDPLIKSRIRSIQREAARKRMMQEVPKATVVITNPQHLAVALKYEDKKMSAPRISAKGAGLIAARIREIAASHGIPVIEDKPLARALFKLELNAFIPEELYVAVAKILAYIYKIKGKI